MPWNSLTGIGLFLDIPVVFCAMPFKLRAQDGDLFDKFCPFHAIFSVPWWRTKEKS